MLGSTAGGLYWMSRQLERSENAVRMIEAGQHIAVNALTRNDAEWVSILKASGGTDEYLKKNKSMTRDLIVDWIIRNPENANSILSNIRQARENARIVRTEITREVWESINQASMSLKKVLEKKLVIGDLPKIIKLVRQHCHQVFGAILGTMLRNEGFNFLRLGTFIERSDNTARLLDIKHFAFFQPALSHRSGFDNIQVHVILRSVSSDGGFRLLYGNDLSPRNIAEFLINDIRMPRSLRFSFKKIMENIRYLVDDYDFEPESFNLANDLAAHINYYGIDNVLAFGLNAFVRDTLLKINFLSKQIEADYRFFS